MAASPITGTTTVHLLDPELPGLKEACVELSGLCDRFLASLSSSGENPEEIAEVRKCMRKIVDLLPLGLDKTFECIQGITLRELPEDFDPLSETWMCESPEGAITGPLASPPVHECPIPDETYAQDLVHLLLVVPLDQNNLVLNHPGLPKLEFGFGQPVVFRQANIHKVNFECQGRDFDCERKFYFLVSEF